MGDALLDCAVIGRYAKCTHKKIPKWKKILAFGIPYCPEVSLLNEPEFCEVPPAPSIPQGKSPKVHSQFLNHCESRCGEASQPTNKPLPAGLKSKVRLLNPSLATFHFQSNSGKRRRAPFVSKVRGKDGQLKPRDQCPGYLFEIYSCLVRAPNFFVNPLHRTIQKVI